MTSYRPDRPSLSAVSARIVSERAFLVEGIDDRDDVSGLVVPVNAPVSQPVSHDFLARPEIMIKRTPFTRGTDLCDQPSVGIVFVPHGSVTKRVTDFNQVVPLIVAERCSVVSLVCELRQVRLRIVRVNKFLPAGSVMRVTRPSASRVRAMLLPEECVMPPAVMVRAFPLASSMRLTPAQAIEFNPSPSSVVSPNSPGVIQDVRTTDKEAKSSRLSSPLLR